MGRRAEKMVKTLADTTKEEEMPVDLKLMDFGSVFAHLKRGKKVRRQYWDPDYFIYLVSGSSFEVSRAPLNTIFPAGTKVNYESHIDYCVSGNSCGVWTPTMHDIMAEDWVVMELRYVQDSDNRHNMASA